MLQSGAEKMLILTKEGVRTTEMSSGGMYDEFQAREKKLRVAPDHLL